MNMSVDQINLTNNCNVPGRLRGEETINVHEDEFCSSAINSVKMTPDISDNVRYCVAKSTGSSGEPLSQIRITGSCDHCLIIFNHQSNGIGPCQFNKTVTYNQEKVSCPEQREYFRGEIKLLLQIAKKTQPSFSISFVGKPH